MEKEKTIDHHLRATWQAISKMYNEEAAKHGSTMSVAFILLSIEKKGTPSTALGPMMGMEATSMSRTLKSMEEKGLIYREANPDDGRSVLVKLTPFGKEKRNLSKASVIQFNKAINESIKPEKLSVFFEVIDIVNQTIKSKNIFN